MLLHKYQSWILKIIAFLAHIGYLVKLLSNHWTTLSPENLENISNFEGWGLTLVAYRKRVVLYRFNFYVVDAFFHKQHFYKQRQAKNWQKTNQMLSNTLRLNFCYYLYSSFTLPSKNNRTYSNKKEKENVCQYSWDYSENDDKNEK